MIVNDKDQSKITEIRIETRWNQFWLHAVTLQSHISVETKYEFNILIFTVRFFRRCRRFAVVFIQYTDSKNQTFNYLHGVRNSWLLPFLSVESRDNFVCCVLFFMCMCVCVCVFLVRVSSLWIPFARFISHDVFCDLWFVGKCKFQMNIT